jgi:hypothetical protein
MRARRSIAAITLVVTFGAVGLAACSSTEEVSTKTLQEQVTAELTKTVGTAPDSVTCNDALPAKEGSTVRCSLTAQGTTYGLTVTSQGKTSDNKVSFSIQVDSTPQN